jgi:chromosome segregation ATPase
MTDTADLVKCLRKYQNEPFMTIGARPWVAECIGALSSTQARADKLEEELAALRDELKVSQTGDSWRAYHLANYSLGKAIDDPYEDRALFSRINRVKRWYDDVKARAESAESSLAAAKERVRLLELEILELNSKLESEIDHTTRATELRRQHQRRALAAESALKDVRNAALEEAARIADNHSYPSKPAESLWGIERTAIGQSIRALKTAGKE